MRPLTRAALVAAAIGGATAGATLAAVQGGRRLIAHQGQLVRGMGESIGWQLPEEDGAYGAAEGQPLDLLMLGDSIAAGLGATEVADALGARLATGIAAELGRPVQLRTDAWSGATAHDLDKQLERTRGSGYAPDLAVVVVGGNDVIQRVPPRESAALLARAVQELRERGSFVVVGTCPDFGALAHVPQPLRTAGALTARRMASAQRRAAGAAGARVVELAHLVGPAFREAPVRMFAADLFHPSSAGYEQIAAALLPVAVQALEKQAATAPSDSPA